MTIGWKGPGNAREHVHTDGDRQKKVKTAKCFPALSNLFKNDSHSGTISQTCFHSNGDQKRKEKNESTNALANIYLCIRKLLFWEFCPIEGR